MPLALFIVRCVIMSARLALPGAQCCHVGLVDCRWAPGARPARGDLLRSLVHRWSPVTPPRLAPAIKRSTKHWTLRCLLFRQGLGSATKNSVGPRPASRVLLSNVLGDRSDVQPARPLLRQLKAVAIHLHQGRRRIVHAHDPIPRPWQYFAAGSKGIEQRKMQADSLGRQR